MAVELEVKINKPIDIGHLLGVSSQVIRELLGGVACPPLSWTKDDDKFPGDLKSTIFEIDYFKVHLLNSHAWEKCLVEV